MGYLSRGTGVGLLMGRRPSSCLFGRGNVMSSMVRSFGLMSEVVASSRDACSVLGGTSVIIAYKKAVKLRFDSFNGPILLTTEPPCSRFNFAVGSRGHIRCRGGLYSVSRFVRPLSPRLGSVTHGITCVFFMLATGARLGLRVKSSIFLLNERYSGDGLCSSVVGCGSMVLRRRGVCGLLSSFVGEERSLLYG